MKILFLTSRLPYPPMGGDKLRAFKMLELLAQSNEIYLLSFIESAEENKYVEELKKLCKEVKTILLPLRRSYLNCILNTFSFTPMQVSYYRHPKMFAEVKKFIDKYKIDDVYAHLIRMAPYVKNLRIFKVLDMTDAISLSLKRTLKYRSPGAYLFYFLEWLRVMWYEKKIIRYFDKILLITSEERSAIGEVKGVGRIEIVQNGVNYKELKPSSVSYDKTKIAFVGNLHSFPNRDAVAFFYDEVLPLIKKEVMDVKFYVIGINPTPKILQLNKDKNVIVTGRVENLKDYLEDSACFVCPIRNGAGLQNKILEAMSLGLPVVTTSIGLEGIKMKDGEDLLVADNPRKFAEKVLKIMKDTGLRAKISRNARAKIEKNYGWEGVGNKMKQIFKCR